MVQETIEFSLYINRREYHPKFGSDVKTLHTPGRRKRFITSVIEAFLGRSKQSPKTALKSLEKDDWLVIFIVVRLVIWL